MSRASSVFDRAAASMFEVDHDRLVGEPVSTILESVLSDQRIRGYLVADTLDPYETTYRSPGGVERRISISTSVMRRQGSQAVALVCVARDVTELKRTEEALRTLNAELEDRVAQRTAELETANRELEAFSYSVVARPAGAAAGHQRVRLAPPTERRRPAHAPRTIARAAHPHRMRSNVSAHRRTHGAVASDSFRLVQDP